MWVAVLVKQTGLCDYVNITTSHRICLTKGSPDNNTLDIWVDAAKHSYIITDHTYDALTAYLEGATLGS